MFIRVQINITVTDPRGWVNGVEIFEHLDTTQPITEQCIAAAKEWVERRNRIFGTEFSLRMVPSCFFEDRGFWYTVETARPDARWPLSVSGV